MGPAGDAASEWCLQHGGEMGARMRVLDWSRTSLGPVATWPRALKVAVALCLRSRFPIVIFWGRDYTMLYNDAYIPVLGAAKHPGWLGMSGRECWREVWPTVGPMMESVLATGEPVWSEDLLLFLDRRLPREECYFTFSYSAIPTRQPPAAAGVFCVCAETTERVIGERRLRTLYELGSGALLAGCEAEAADAAAGTLAASRADLPFMLLYLLDHEHRSARLSAVSGLKRGAAATPDNVDVQALAHDPWRLREVMLSGSPLLIEHLEERAGEFPQSAFAGASAPASALVLPLRTAGNTLGFLVAGASPHVVLDDSYRAFFSLVAAHIATGVAAARAIDEERRRVRELAEVARRAHEREREDFRTLFTQAPNVFLILRGREYIIELANPPACRMLHRGDHEILGRPLFGAVPELEGTTFRATLDSVLRTGEPYQGREVAMTVHWRGEVAPRIEYYNYVFSPLRSIEGRIEGVLIDAFSVTEEVIARQEMGCLRAEAESANRMKDAFLAMLGHELRNPLAPMVMALQVMRLRGATSREQDILERQVSHLTRLVDDLLDVSRITRGKIELLRRPLELSEPVACALETIGPLFTERRHRVEIDVPAQGLMVLADPERLAQVLLNLLTNAAKYSETGSAIRVQARRRGGRIELCVRDEGMGIAPEMLEKVFDAFVQQPQTLDRSAGGLGLGLAIVRSLIEMHDGTVSARSAGPGKGSEFIIDLPALDPQHPASGPVRSWSSLVPGRRSQQS
ncbi:MAG: PAS domain-containing protein [Gammaproteobacteria bacterium]|nr:PAS domain-containing protein [Gammaproteobacteria bacterium]